MEPLTGVATFVDLPSACASCGAAVDGAEWPALPPLEAAGASGERTSGPMVLQPCGHELAGGA